MEETSAASQIIEKYVQSYRKRCHSNWCSFYLLWDNGHRSVWIYKYAHKPMLKRENLPSFRFLPHTLPPLAHHYRLLSYWYYMQSSNERICPHRMNVCVCNFFPSNSGTHKRKQAQKKRTLFSYMDLSIAMFSYQTHWVVNWQKILLSGRLFLLLSLVHHRISCLRLWLLGTRLHETRSFMHVYSFITFVCNYAILTESSSSCHCIMPLCRLKWTNFE